MAHRYLCKENRHIFRRRLRAPVTRDPMIVGGDAIMRARAASKQPSGSSNGRDGADYPFLTMPIGAERQPRHAPCYDNTH